MPEWLTYDHLRRGLSPAIVLLNKVSSELNLPEHVNNYSIRLYEILLMKKLTKGRRRESLIGACIYISCQGTNYPINLKHLCKSLDVTKRDLIRQKKVIKRFVETNEQGVSINSYINRYGHQLGLEPRTITHAMTLSKSVNKELMNRTTRIKATTCLYLVARDKISIRQLARLTGLSISGIHASIKQLKNKKLFTDILLSEKPIIFLESKKKK